MWKWRKVTNNKHFLASAEKSTNSTKSHSTKEQRKGAGELWGAHWKNDGVELLNHRFKWLGERNLNAADIILKGLRSNPEGIDK